MLQRRTTPTRPCMYVPSSSSRSQSAYREARPVVLLYILFIRFRRVGASGQQGFSWTDCIEYRIQRFSALAEKKRERERGGEWAVRKSGVRSNKASVIPASASILLFTYEIAC